MRIGLGLHRELFVGRGDVGLAYLNSGSSVYVVAETC